jgi:hypothetical protein
VGRASNRKKEQRQSGQAKRQSSSDAATQQAMQALASGEQLLERLAKRHQERQDRALRIWCAQAKPVPAKAVRWVTDSVGDRFFSSEFIDRTRYAPSPATTRIPAAAVIAADPAHWEIAVQALIRGMIFDGLGLDHPAMSALLEALAPIAQAELAFHEAADAAMYDWDEDEPEFPEEDGPVFAIGGCALVDAVWAAVGEDPLTDVLGVMRPALADAVPGVDAQAVADALIGAFAVEYRCEQPGDVEVLERIEHHHGDSLRNLVAAEAIMPADVLPVGLTILKALARLCRTDAASVLHPAA